MWVGIVSGMVSVGRKTYLIAVKSARFKYKGAIGS